MYLEPCETSNKELVSLVVVLYWMKFICIFEIISTWSVILPGMDNKLW